MDARELMYNGNVEAFRDKEYPMLKGKCIEAPLYTIELNQSARCYLSRSCRNCPTSQVFHGEVYVRYDV
jgi:hypothetical protein